MNSTIQADFPIFHDFPKAFHMTFSWDKYIDNRDISFKELDSCMPKLDSYIPEIVERVELLQEIGEDCESVLQFLDSCGANQAHRRKMRNKLGETGLFSFETNGKLNVYLQLGEWYLKKAEEVRTLEELNNFQGKSIRYFAKAFRKTKLDDCSILDTFLERNVPPYFKTFMNGTYLMMVFGLIMRDQSKHDYLWKIKDYLLEEPNGIHLEIVNSMVAFYTQHGNHAKASILQTMLLNSTDV